MLNIFIDTNIFLSFYSLTSNDLDELKKIITLIQCEEIKLYLSQNVIDEYYKNRLKKIHSTLSDFSKENTINIPALLTFYTQCIEIKNLRKNLTEKINEILALCKKDATNFELGADKIIKEIFDSAIIFPVDYKIFRESERRFLRRFPPRKNDDKDSIGDAINWETLLEHIPDGDIHLISSDNDFRDSLYKDYDMTNFFLSQEWRNKKNGQLYAYSDLNKFFEKKFVTYNFQVSKILKEKINKLINSSTFATTHEAIKELSEISFNDYTIKDINKLIEAFYNNSQISSIISDEDIAVFYVGLIKNRLHLIDISAYGILKTIEIDYPSLCQDYMPIAQKIKEESEIPF